MKPIDLISGHERIISEVAKGASSSLKKEITEEAVNETIGEIFGAIFANSIDSENSQFDKVDVQNKDLTALIGEIYLKTATIASNELASDGYLRSQFSSKWIGEFIRSVALGEISSIHPLLTKVQMVAATRQKVEVLKQISYVLQIMSPKLRVVEYRGKEIVSKIFDVPSSDSGRDLLPADFKAAHDKSSDETEKMRCVCDFIAGMTNRYAIEFYARLVSEHPQTIFKPF